MSDTPQVLLAHHLKALRLPTFLRENRDEVHVFFLPTFPATMEERRALRPIARWRHLLLTEGGAGADRALAGALQHAAATLVAGLPPADAGRGGKS